MRTTLNLIHVLMIASAVAMTGCSNIRPTLVNDSNAAEPGLRYYETRPFIVVKQPYPIQSSAYLVAGTVSADGTLVTISALPAELASRAPTSLTGAWRIPVSSILATQNASRDKVVAQAANEADEGGETDEVDEPDEVGEDGEGSEDDDKDSNGGDTANQEQPPPTRTMGFSNITVTTDISALARFELSKNISLIYLPDYEREFLVDTRNKLGTTRLTLNLGPGSTLMGMSGQVDNSIVATALLGSMQTLLTGGTDRLLGVITKAGKATVTGESVIAQSATGELKSLAGHSVSLRAHLVKFAAIGVYPLVKPSELNNTGYKNSGDTNRKFLLPVASYQIPYDYYEVLLFEHVLGGVPSGFIVTNEVPDIAKDSISDCSGRLPKDDIDNWWSKALAAMSEGGDKARMQQLEVATQPNASAGNCHSKVTILVKAKPGTAEPKDDDLAKVTAFFNKQFPNTQPATQADR